MTPFVLFDLDRLRENARRFRLPDVRVAAAAKACYVPGVLAALRGEVDHFDVQSAHEAELCPVGARLSFHGPILRLPDRPVDWVSFNSARQWRSCEFVEGRRYGARLSLGEERLDKFGLDEEEAVAFLRSCPGEPFLHMHALRRLHDPALAVRVTALFAALAARVARRAGRTLRTVNLGGGYDGQLELRLAGVSLAEILRLQIEAVRRELPEVEEVLVEPGRALFEDAGVAVTRIHDVLERPDGRVLIVDIASNLLVPLPQSRFRPFSLDPRPGPLVPTSVADGTCRARGVVAVADLPASLAPGDLLGIENAGAYTYSFASTFFSPIPPALGLEGGEVHQL